MSVPSWRILVTGSRDWVDRAAISHALASYVGIVGAPAPSAVTLVHGAARGADSIAASIAKAWGMTVEAHPADWERYGRRAGPVRNAEMVALGADVMIAFPLGRSIGTRHCMGLAAKAGIPIIVAESAEANDKRSAV